MTRPRQSSINKEGKVVEVLSNAMFRVELDDGSETIAHISGKMRQNHIKILVGDIIKLEISPFDSSKARVVLYWKN